MLARAQAVDRARLYRESILPLKLAIDLRYAERHTCAATSCCWRAPSCCRSCGRGAGCTRSPVDDGRTRRLVAPALMMGAARSRSSPCSRPRAPRRSSVTGGARPPRREAEARRDEHAEAMSRSAREQRGRRRGRSGRLPGRRALLVGAQPAVVAASGASGSPAIGLRAVGRAAVVRRRAAPSPRCRRRRSRSSSPRSRRRRRPPGTVDDEPKSFSLRIGESPSAGSRPASAAAPPPRGRGVVAARRRAGSRRSCPDGLSASGSLVGSCAAAAPASSAQRDVDREQQRR